MRSNPLSLTILIKYDTLRDFFSSFSRISSSYRNCASIFYNVKMNFEDYEVILFNK